MLERIGSAFFVAREGFQIFQDWVVARWSGLWLRQKVGNRLSDVAHVIRFHAKRPCFAESWSRLLAVMTS